MPHPSILDGVFSLYVDRDEPGLGTQHMLLPKHHHYPSLKFKKVVLLTTITSPCQSISTSWFQDHCNVCGLRAGHQDVCARRHLGGANHEFDVCGCRAVSPGVPILQFPMDESLDGFDHWSHHDLHHWPLGMAKRSALMRKLEFGWWF